MSQNQNELPQYLKDYKTYLEGRPLFELKQIYSFMDKTANSEKASLLKEHIAAMEAGQALEPDNKKAEPFVDQQLFSHAEILELIQHPSEKKTGISHNLVLLVVSLLIFAGTGLFEWKPLDLGILVVVLLIHEIGHLLAMKAFKYKDVKMFFLPFIGAAVSGREGTPYESRKALVSLLGPFPGILIGLGLAIWYGISKQPILFQASTLFVYINAFNLLPLYPLDGGRFLDSVLFARNFVVETIFKIATSLLLALLAVSIQAWLLLILPVSILLSLRQSFHASEAARKVRSELDIENATQLSLSEDIVKRIRESLSPRAISAAKSAKQLSAIVETTWNCIYSIRPKFLKTSLLLGTYGIAVVFSLAAAGALIGIQEFGKYDRRLVKNLNADSVMVCSQHTYRDSILIDKTELDSLGFFHGKSWGYTLTGEKINKVGHWKHGKWDGDWTFYDSLAMPYRITTYENGKFINEKVLKVGEWKVKGWDNLSKLEQTTYNMHYEGKPERSPVWSEKNLPE